ncbi:hypothetical protein LWI28_017814 [Acer negundo]|uniref:Uncharacterized protein n=1 Tax=Acer negundo TaxID=4023 RepID=A0AAD5J6V8_ACENE|nr:hypothetical protein LWI28_017814 [Acer negundo]
MSGGVFVSPLLASEVLMFSCGFLINYGYVGSGRFKLIMVMSGGVSASPLLAYVLLRLLNKIWAVGYTKAFGHDRPDSSHFGLTLHLMHAIPLNKKLCTSSYVCLTSAAALVFLTIYPLVYIWDLKYMFLPLERIGMNAMLVYVMVAGIFAGFSNGWLWIRWNECGHFVTTLGLMETENIPSSQLGGLNLFELNVLELAMNSPFYRHQVRDADGELQMQYGIQVMRTSNVIIRASLFLWMWRTFSNSDEFWTAKAKQFSRNAY